MSNDKASFFVCKDNKLNKMNSRTLNDIASPKAYGMYK